VNDIDIDIRLDRLAHEGASPEDLRRRVAQLVDHIEATHHRYLWDELPRLADLIDTVLDAHAPRHPELLAISDTFATLRAEIEPHLQREETEVFPMLRRLVAAEEPPAISCRSVGEPLTGLLDDHDVVVELVATLRELTDGYRPPDDSCATYWTLYDALRSLDTDTQLHVRMENEVLFPAAVRVGFRSRDE
jgi:regulator of cell morphogenesis and NO signaling